MKGDAVNRLGPNDHEPNATHQRPALPDHVEQPADGRDIEFADLLAAFDESLSSDNRVPIDFMDHVSELGLLHEFENAKECIDALEQIWPRIETPVAADGVTPDRGVAPPGPPEHRLSPSSLSRWPDRKLGRFEIQRMLGRGGGGIVYLAFDPNLNRHVTLKVPHPQFLFDPDLRHRFLNEAHIAAGLDHPHIVPVYEISEVGPICFIVAAYCDGPTLADWLQKQDRPASQFAAARFVSVLANSVEYAHGCGILHRDLKPSNVLLEPLQKGNSNDTSVSSAVNGLDGFNPKLTDFGLAKMLTGDTQNTCDDAVLGTPEYMAPEQAEGRSVDIGPATDVYALGVILYELLTGRPPFREASCPKLLRQIVFDEPPHPRRFRQHIDRDLAAICLKCLAKNPRARYARATELAEDLQLYLSGRPTVARPVGIGGAALKWTVRHPATAALWMISVLFLAFVVIGSFRYQFAVRKTRQTTAQAQETAAQLEKEVMRRQQERRRNEYVDNVSGAYLAWGNGEVATALELLDRCCPSPGEQDQRGFEWYYVRRVCDGGLSKMSGHQGRSIHGSSFSSDGSRLATCGEDGVIQIWNPMNGALLANVPGGAEGVNDIGFSPDGRFLAGVGGDGCVRLWDAQTYELQRTTKLQTDDDLFCLAISRDGQRVAVAGDGGGITICDVQHDTQPIVISTGCERIYSLDFAADGRLAAACSDHTAKIWDLASDVPIRVVNPRAEIYSVAFSPDGRRLATGGALLHIWHLDSEQVPTFLPGHENYIHSVAFSADGRLLASTGNDEVIRIWDLATDTTRYKFLAHTRPVLDLAFAPQECLLASADKGGTVRIWNADAPQDRRPVLMGTQNQSARLDFSPVDNTLAIATIEKRSISVWTANADESVPSVQMQPRCSINVPDASPPQCVTYSPTGRYLAVGTVTDWFLLDRKFNAIDTTSFEVQGTSLCQLTFGSSDDCLAISSAGPESQVPIVDIASGREVNRFYGYRAIAISPDGSLLATESTKTVFAIELWDLMNGVALATMPGHTAQTHCLAFSANGRMLASGGGDGSVRIWDVRRKEEIKTLRGHADAVRQLTFSPNQKNVVTASDDGTVRFWDVASGRVMLTLPVTSGRVNSFSFSPDGQILATASVNESSEDESRVDLWYAPQTMPVTSHLSDNDALGRWKSQITARYDKTITF